MGTYSSSQPIGGSQRIDAPGTSVADPVTGAEAKVLSSAPADSTMGVVVRVVGPVPGAMDAGEQTLVPVPFTVTAMGDTTVATPASGKRFRLRKIKAISDPQGSSSPLITVKLGATEVARGYVVSERQALLGGVGDPLVINLSVAGSVSGTAYVEEI